MNSQQLQQYAQANYDQIIGNYESALILYNKLAAEVEVYEIHIGKSIAAGRLHQFEQALKDAENAILLDRKRWEGYYYRGLFSFQNGAVKASLIDLETALEKCHETSAQKRIEVQVSKVKSELNANPLPVLDATQALPQIVGAASVAPKSGNTAAKIKYSWYQTISKVGIDIEFSLTNKELLKHKFTERTAHVSFPLEQDRTYDMNLDLFDEIVAESVKVTVYLNKIEIVMEKKSKDKSWLKLEADAVADKDSAAQDKQPEAKKENAIVTEQVKPFYPSSSKVKKDWSKIDHEIEADIEKNREEYGVDPLNSLFQQIYANSNEDTRKAMVKSFQTSGGTVLSTNWDEVASKDYNGKDRPEPPKGQEYRKWEK